MNVLTLKNYIPQYQTPQSRSSTHTVISTVAYLIGVPLRIFENENEPPKLEIYQALQNDKHARIIRNLCILRTDIERNFRAINDAIRFEYKSLLSLTDIITTATIDSLANDGVYIKSKRTTSQYIVDINGLILNRINNCKNLFPIWLNWQYVREIFIMPNGLNEKGTADAANEYYKNMTYYPYQLYMNWPPSDNGNILYSDSKFVKLLYSWYNDVFDDLKRISDAGADTKESIYDFLEHNSRTLIVVDCENSDPYKLCAALRGLKEERLGNITKVILYDDIHATNAWESLEGFIGIPVERILVERIKKDKSLVDPMLIGGVFREFYKSDVDSFVLVSSDSDYWGLINSLPEANWLVMIESEKCGPDMKAALQEAGIFYCYLDDFNADNSFDFTTHILIKEVEKYLKGRLSLNVHQMMEHVTHNTRINMPGNEQRTFFDKYIKQMHVIIDDDGEVSLSLKKY